MAPCMPLAAPAVSCPARFHFMRLGRPLRAGLKAADAGKLDILHWNGCRRLQEAAQRERHARLIAEASVDKAGSGDKQGPVAAAKLSWSVKEALRTQVQNLMREGELPTIHLGKNGLSHNFFVSVTDCLQANEFVRVKVGNCFEEIPDLIAEIERTCDCACVHHVGFTFFLYREPGLPRPKGMPTPEPARVPTEASASRASPKKKSGRGAGGRSLPDIDKPPAFTVLS